MRVHGSRDCGEIKDIYYDFDRVQWENDKPYFIEVLLDNGKCWAYNVHQLTTKRVR